MNKLIIILIFKLIAVITIAQDVQFSQYYAAPLYLAPSFTGATEGSRIIANYRNQWPEIPGAFVSYQLSYDHYFPNLNSGAGIMFLRDQAGSGKLSTTNIGLLYSYNFSISNKWELKPGINFTYAQRGLDFNRLVFGDQVVYNSNTSIEVPVIDKTRYYDFSSSLLAYSERNWFGFSIDHILTPNQTLIGMDSKIPMKYSLFGGKRFTVNNREGRFDEESISLTFLYKQQGDYDQLDIGGYWSKRPLVIGLWLRGLPFNDDYLENKVNQDALVVLAGYQLDDIKIGYSYDFTISGLSNKTGGAHEISIIYEFWQDQKLRKRKRRIVVSCPKF